MSNERYLVVSYFVFAALCLGLGVVAYSILRKPFERLSDATVGSRGAMLKRALAFSMAAAGVLGFFAFSYTQKGCVSYEQVTRNRDFLVEANVKQVQGAADWIAWTVLAWGVAVVIGLWSIRRRKTDE